MLEIGSGKQIRRSEQTELAYAKRATQIINLVYGGRAAYAEDDPTKLVNWLAAQDARLRFASWRQYHAAITYELEQAVAYSRSTNNKKRLTQSEEALAKMSVLRKSEQGAGDANLAARTSSLKAKFIKEEDLEVIEKYLLSQGKAHRPQSASQGEKSDSLKAQSATWAYRAYWMLKAGVLTGLRPSEWMDAELVTLADAAKSDWYHELAPWYKDLCDQPPAGITQGVLVKNAKNSNGRATGKYRVVLTPNGGVPSIRQNLDSIAVWQAEQARAGLAQTMTSIQRYCKYAQQALATICAPLFPRRRTKISLYSARHQYCANIRSAMQEIQKETKGVRPKLVVALLMGHRSLDTAGTHYGKPRDAHRSSGGITRNLCEGLSKISPPVHLRREIVADDFDKQKKHSTFAQRNVRVSYNKP